MNSHPARPDIRSHRLTAHRPEPHLRTVTSQVFAGPYNFRNQITKREGRGRGGLPRFPSEWVNFRRLGEEGLGGFTSFSIMGIKRDAGREKGNCEF